MNKIFNCLLLFASLCSLFVGACLMDFGEFLHRVVDRRHHLAEKRIAELKTIKRS